MDKFRFRGSLPLPISIAKKLAYEAGLDPKEIKNAPKMARSKFTIVTMG